MSASICGNVVVIQHDNAVKILRTLPAAAIWKQFYIYRFVSFFLLFSFYGLIITNNLNTL